MFTNTIDTATEFEKRFEKINTNVFDNSANASKAAAQQIAALIKEKQSQNKTCVLGLATGSSPKSLYAELVRLHREEQLSFKNVTRRMLSIFF